MVSKAACRPIDHEYHSLKLNLLPGCDMQIDDCGMSLMIYIVYCNRSNNVVAFLKEDGKKTFVSNLPFIY